MQLSILNSAVLYDKSLTLTDLRVYGAICQYANTKTHLCFPKQSSIAAQLGITIPMVSRSIKNLTTKKYLVVVPKLHNGRKEQNTYQVIYDGFTSADNSVIDDGIIPTGNSELTSVDKSEVISQDNSGVISDGNSVDCRITYPDKSGFTSADNSYIDMNSFNSLTPLTIEKEDKEKELFKEQDIPKTSETGQATLFKETEKPKPEKKVKEKKEKVKKVIVEEVLPEPPAEWGEQAIWLWHEKWLKRDPAGKIKTNTARAARGQIAALNWVKSEGGDITEALEYATDEGRETIWEGLTKAHFGTYLRDLRFRQRNNTFKQKTYNVDKIIAMKNQILGPSANYKPPSNKDLDD